MMKIAIVLQCHKTPELLNMFLEVMRHPSIVFFIHVDKKSEITNLITKREDIVLLDDTLRVDVQWGNISQVDATLHLLKYAKSYGKFDFYWLCSGQDFPIKPIEQIVSWFNSHKENDFMELFHSKNNGLGVECNFDKRNAIVYPHWMLGNSKKKRIIKRAWVEVTGGYKRTFSIFRRKNTINMSFYFGSSWVCVSNRTLTWIFDYLNNHNEYYVYFSKCNCPDESFFQTLVMNSPFAGMRMDYLHYVDWSEGNNNPKILNIEDYEKVMNSNYLLARKIDSVISKELLEKIKIHICPNDGAME